MWIIGFYRTKLCDLEDFLTCHEVGLCISLIFTYRHELYESDVRIIYPCKLYEVHDFIVIEILHKDYVEFHAKSGIFCGFYSPYDLAQLTCAGYVPELLFIQGIKAYVYSVKAAFS